MFLDTNLVVDALRRFLPAMTYLATAEQQGMLALSTPSQPDDLWSDGRAPLLKAVHGGRFLLSVFPIFPTFLIL